jgi:hypothetical protein
MFDRIGLRVTEFVGTTVRRGLHAVEELVPGIQPPRRRWAPARTAAKGLLAASAVAAAAAAVSRSPLQGRAGGKGAPSGAGNGEVDLTEKTKEELYELAKDADIPGRSTMTKAELADAIED